MFLFSKKTTFVNSQVQLTRKVQFFSKKNEIKKVGGKKKVEISKKLGKNSQIAVKRRALKAYTSLQ